MKNKTVLKGTYCILMHLKSDAVVTVGRLGKLEFHAGYYVYVGSALNSLMPRIKRHLSPDKKMHWHIDYFLGCKDVEVVDVIYTVDNSKWECELARKIADNGSMIDNFGCSDCKCNSHLLHFKELGDLKENCFNSFQILGLYSSSYFEIKKGN